LNDEVEVGNQTMMVIIKVNREFKINVVGLLILVE
jgi:hypothetical protein